MMLLKESGDVDLVATKAIQSGEEITIDYRQAAADVQKLLCRQDPQREALPVSDRQREEGGAGCTAGRRVRGAPKGERNGMYRHGYFAAEAIADRAAIRKWTRESRGFATAI